MRRCIFCHEPLSGNQAKEHVLPRWLEREIGSDFKYYSHAINGDTGNEFTISSEETMIETARTRVEGRVCKQCNNNWLSSLEVQAKPLVSALVFGHRSIDTLDTQEKIIVAAWSYKTLLVGVSSGKGEFGIHPCDYHAFRATGLPGSWFNIYAAVLDSDCPGFCGPVELKWPPTMGAKYQGVEALGLKWAYRIGKLHLVFCNSTAQNSVQIVVEGWHQPLWTPQKYRTRERWPLQEIETNSFLQWLTFGLTPVLGYSST